MALAMLVRETPKEYIHHDQLFKQLFHTFFAEFLEAFFPEVHHHIDFSNLTAFRKKSPILKECEGR